MAGVRHLKYACGVNETAAEDRNATFEGEEKVFNARAVQMHPTWDSTFLLCRTKPFCGLAVATCSQLPSRYSDTATLSTYWLTARTSNLSHCVVSNIDNWPSDLPFQQIRSRQRNGFVTPDVKIEQ